LGIHTVTKDASVKGQVVDKVRALVEPERILAPLRTQQRENVQGQLLLVG
jgi:hypothetical protein